MPSAGPSWTRFSSLMHCGLPSNRRKQRPRNYVSEADMVLADVAFLRSGSRRRKRASRHAVCIDTMSDSGVAALRSVLDIPVIGPGRASMLTAMLLGSRFSVVTMWKHWFHLMKTIGDLGIQGVASPRSARPTSHRTTSRSGRQGREHLPTASCRGKGRHRRGWGGGHSAGFDNDAPGARIPQHESGGSGDQSGAADLQADRDNARPRAFAPAVPPIRPLLCRAPR